MNENYQRGAGILCHISSLPNKYGIGSLGKEAYAFADFLKKSHVKYWQILPLVQTGFGDSPYQSVCCNSGNPYFIDLEALKDEGLLDDEELESARISEGYTDYGALYETRFNVLRLAYARFNIKTPDFVRFMQEGRFEDYAVFMSLKSRYGGTFDTFPDAYKFKEHLAIEEFRQSVYKSEYCFWQFLQYVFFKQWKKLKAYVNSLGIKIIGDIPLYVAYDSSDVWGHPSLFKLDENLKPTAVAGVPPDYFSQKGQLWGNPLYDWDALSSENYEWWIDRIAHAAEMYDVIRIDHFRGFDRYWEVPAGDSTARYGHWEDGPKEELFKDILGYKIVAEDLGVIDDGVRRLMKNVGYPGMKVLEFAFDGKADNEHKPSNHTENFVCYTGTHDNMPLKQYIDDLSEEQRAVFAEDVVKESGILNITAKTATSKELCRSVVELAFASKSDTAIVPVWDLLALGGEARINEPSTVSDKNWSRRFLKEDFSKELSGYLKKVSKRSKRA